MFIRDINDLQIVSSFNGGFSYPKLLKNEGFFLIEVSNIFEPLNQAS